jgi:hypothetical protein
VTVFWVAGPLRVTVKLIGLPLVFELPSATGDDGLAMMMLGPASSFLMVPSAPASLMVALAAPLNTTLKFSFASSTVSPITLTVKVVVVEPAGIVRGLDVAV